MTKRTAKTAKASARPTPLPVSPGLAGPSRARLPRPTGRIAPVSLVLGARAASLAAIAVAYYVMAFFCAVQVVPLTMGFVKDGTGIQMSDRVDTVIAVWIAPALFLVALIFVGLLLAMRALWRLRAAGLARVSAWALSTQDRGVSSPAARSPKTAPTRDNVTTDA